MKQRINKNKAISLLTFAMIAIGTLIITYAAISLYTTYRTDKQIGEIIQYCKDIGGYITLYTDNGYNASLKVNTSTSTNTIIDLIGGNSNIKSASCSPTGTAYVTLPNGSTILPTGVNPGGLVE